MPHKYHHHHSNPEEEGKSALYFILALEIILVLYFIGLAVATYILDHFQRIPILLFSVHIVIFLEAFKLIRKYRNGSLHKSLNTDRSIENIGRSIGGFLILLFDLFSLVLVSVDETEYHSFAVWVATIVFWSLAALSSISFIGVTIAYSEHQLEHLQSKMKV